MVRARAEALRLEALRGQRDRTPARRASGARPAEDAQDRARGRVRAPAPPGGAGPSMPGTQMPAARADGRCPAS